MNQRFERIRSYVTAHWATPTEHKPEVFSTDSSFALFHNENQGILVLLQQGADMRAIRQDILPFSADMHIVPVFYGDEKQFFRSAAGELVKKLEHPRNVGSLWKYSRRDIEQSLLLHPLEIARHEHQGRLHYFHESPEMIATYTATPFSFDYTRHTHLPEGKPLHVASKRYFSLTRQFESQSADLFALENGVFVAKTKKQMDLELK